MAKHQGKPADEASRFDDKTPEEKAAEFDESHKLHAHSSANKFPDGQGMFDSNTPRWGRKS